MQVNYHDDIAIKHAGIELIEYLKSQFPYANQPWETLFTEQRICLDGEPAIASTQLIANQHLSIAFSNYSEAPVDTAWRLLWHKGDIAAVHKPPSLPVSRTTRNIYNTLISLVKRESDWPDAHLLHRLDLDTSGIVLIGKTQQAATKWQPALKALMKRKCYHAVIYGTPAWVEKVVSCELTTRKESDIRCQMHVCHDDEKGKYSETHFRILERGENFSIVECELVTGRKHQIRAHLAHLGHPIVGDKIYANNGEYYLKRLNDATTQEDEAKLLTSCHLLFAREVTVQLGESAETEHVVTNPFYPVPWQRFCRQHGLSIGLVQ